MPKALAVMKCPNSWQKMMTPSTNTVAAGSISLSRRKFIREDPVVRCGRGLRG
jgi:hypothetical protein